MFALVVTCLTIAWIAFIVRFSSRILRARKIRLDDWLLLIAMVFFCGQCGCLIGIDPIIARSWSKNVQNRSYVLLAFYKLVLLSSIFLKASLAISLARFFDRSWQRWLIAVITITFGIFAIAEFIFSLFFCGLPATFISKTSIYECKRWREAESLVLASAIFNAVTDWVYILLPAVVIWQSKLSRAAKASTSVVTIIGALSGAAAILRAIDSASFTPTPGPDHTPFITATKATVVEIGLGIVAVSLSGSTTLLNLFRSSRAASITIPGEEGSISIREETDVFRLSPIIFEPKSDQGGASLEKRLSTTSTRETTPPVLVMTAKKANRFSWSRSFGAPGTPFALSGNITLLIDDVSDDEGDSGASISHEKKKSLVDV